MNYYKISIAPLILLEIIASVVFVLTFGFGEFCLFLLFSMVGGVVLLAIFWKNMLEFKISTPKEMLTQFAFVIAAFLLIIPGVLSSILGILVLIFGLVFRSNTKRSNFDQNHPKQDYDDGEIIDVEIIDEKNKDI